MATKRWLFRLLARISRVFAVIVKHAVTLLSRIWVTVGWGGILVVDHGCARHVDIYPVCTWDFHFHWLLFISRTEDMMLISSVELITSNDTIDTIEWAVILRDLGKMSWAPTECSIECSVILLWYRDIFPCTANAYDGLSRVQMHGVNGQSTYMVWPWQPQINFGLTSAAWFDHLRERSSQLGAFP
jgi:hypothetical protein